MEKEVTLYADGDSKKSEAKDLGPTNPLSAMYSEFQLPSPEKHMLPPLHMGNM